MLFSTQIIGVKEKRYEVDNLRNYLYLSISLISAEFEQTLDYGFNAYLSSMKQPVKLHSYIINKADIFGVAMPLSRRGITIKLTQVMFHFTP